MEINYDNITLDDCITLFELKGKTTIINDGKVRGFEDDAELSHE